MSISASSPGKAILFGEHAVVYGYPAVAVPLTTIRAHAEIAKTSGDSILFHAKDLRFNKSFKDLPTDDPFRFAVELFFTHTGVQRNSGLSITLNSHIPIASGMGSGAAIQTAMMKALFCIHEIQYTTAELSELVYQVEKLYHGSPSGIDNTVTCYEKAILYRRGQGIDFLDFPIPFDLVIANSGYSTPTKIAVGDVKALVDADPTSSMPIFENISCASQRGLDALRSGKWEEAGKMLTVNHSLLQQLTVSNTILDRLVSAANKAGAFGAKLSGGGRGGIVIALVNKSNISPVTTALKEAGAIQCFTVEIGGE